MNACCNGCSTPSFARPSIVVTSAPSFITASVMQELMRRPSTSTVQAPHWPWSQPFLVPVSSSRSRNRSSSVVQGAISSCRRVPLMVRPMKIFAGGARASLGGRAAVSLSAIGLSGSLEDGAGRRMAVQRRTCCSVPSRSTLIWCARHPAVSLCRNWRRKALTTIIYGIKNCDTMKKARAWLDGHGVAYDFHDYKVAAIAQEKLSGWSKTVGWETLLNRAGTTFRKLPDADKEGLNERKALALMLAQPSMIKRPVLDVDGKLLAGFKPEVYARDVPSSGGSRRAKD